MTTYSTIQGDTWDMISFRVYGDEGYIGVLIEANPQHAETTIFSSSIILTVPALPVRAAASTLPPWRTMTEVTTNA